MKADVVAILGVPVDNLTLDEAVERIFSMVDGYAADRCARQVATANVDFVVNTLSWSLDRVRHPELLDVLRRADMVTADGMPLVVLSKLMRTPLKERVAGSDMVPRLAEEAARRGKSLFLLGGREDVAVLAAEKLKAQYPGLRIAGIFSPFVQVEGQALTDAREMDLEIVERINDVAPDILLIAFGNPKQEIWFDRNRYRLHVPVSIGVGGTFEFIAGTLRRAPLWVQRAGLEWAFRIIQDPRRLWKRYAIGFLKFGLLIWPAVVYDRFGHFCYRRRHPNSAERGPEAATPLAVSASEIRILHLPDRLTHASLEHTAEEFDHAFAQANFIVVDFSEVSFIDSTGLGFLIRAWRRAAAAGKPFYFTGVAPNIRRSLELNRCWDLFRGLVFETLEAAWQSALEGSRSPPFFYSVNPAEDHLLIRFFGRLDAVEMARVDLPALLGAMGGKDCILDLQSLRFVDSSGLALFLKIQRALAGQGRQCVLCGLNSNVEQLLRITQLYKLFEIAENVVSARERLRGCS